MITPALAISSYDGDDIRASGNDLVKRLFVNVVTMAYVVLVAPLFLLIELLMWLALRDSRSQD